MGHRARKTTESFSGKRVSLTSAALFLGLIVAQGCQSPDRPSTSCFSPDDCEEGQNCVFGSCVDEKEGSDVYGDTVTATSDSEDSDTATAVSTDTNSDTEQETGGCTDPAADCLDDGNVCTVAVCEGGQCSVKARDGESCDHDENPCTSEICLSDTCTAIPLDKVPCDFDGNECTRDICVEGTCTVAGNLDGTSCNFDDNPCTLDICRQGVCSAEPRHGTPCTLDDNSCTNDVCVHGECTGLPLDNVPCEDDGNTCTKNICRKGQCQVEKLEGTPCSLDGNECTRDKCVDGVCVAEPLSLVSCTAGLGDCMADICVSGVCGKPAGDIPCVVDDNLCTRDRCSPAGECVAHSLGEGALCDDGLLCNGVDKCGPGDVCLRDPDGLECLAPSRCQEPKCTEPSFAGEAPICETVDLDGVSCDNEYFCDGRETCVAGICKMTEAPCQGVTPGTCEKVSCVEPGSCTLAKQDDFTPCPDSNLCDGVEICLAGVCSEGVPECDTKNGCQEGTCAESDGKVICGDPIIADNGTVCDVGNDCYGRGTNRCVDGICTPGETPPCEADGDGSFCSYHLSCEASAETVSCSSPVDGGEPLTVGTLSCTVVTDDTGQQIAKPSYEYSTLLATNEQSMYNGCGAPSGFTGGERGYQVKVDPGASFEIQLSTTSSSKAEALYLFHVLNPCATEGTSCAAFGQGKIVSTADGAGEAFVVIDGFDGNRGSGVITLKCP